MIRSALCLHGLVGNISGKSGEIIVHPEIVLKLAYKHWKKYVIKDNNPDIFIYCWNTNLSELILKLFKPVSSSFEDQIKFDLKDFIPGSESRKQAHYSRWYALYKVNELKRNYEIKNDFKYDYVMNARFDIAWKKSIIFNELTLDEFYINRLVYWKKL